jgi:hypothetical protein
LVTTNPMRGTSSSRRQAGRYRAGSSPRSSGARSGVLPSRSDGSTPTSTIRRQAHQPRPLHRLPDGGSRHPEGPLCRHPAPDRGTAGTA